ncbi:heterokaryon incompatibility protein-domain-containing protein [Xylaria sp. FL1042]|nr:heterokaryon incompatibility protein-domain-containing protein [Xylaria sp. FL1042]
MNTRQADQADDLADFHCGAYRYRKIPKGRHRYIRLLELQPGQFAEKIHVKILEPHRLDIKGKWQALSYVWGSEKDPAVIHVGGMSPDHRACRELKVTRNLEEALRYLRYKHGIRTMWIDSICINQADKAEQSAHVAEMGEIYRNASQVIAWLGAPSDGSSRVLDFLENIACQLNYDPRKRKIELFSDAPYLPVDRADFPAIRQLWEREWFKRVWIRQEIVLAGRALVQIGTRTLPWKQFRNAVVCIDLKCWHQSVDTPKTPAFKAVRAVCMYDTYGLVTLRTMLNGAKCRDPHDYIYGILSLLERDSRRLGIQPDYSKPAVEVYKDIALSWLSRYKNLDILSECELTGQNPATIEGKTLPSWVPDWSSGTAPIRPQGARFSAGFGARHFRPKITRVRSSRSGETDILRVTGVECGIVDQVFKFDHEEFQTLLNDIRSAWLQMEAEWPWKPLYHGPRPSFDAFCRGLGQGMFQEEFFSSNGFCRFSDFREKVMAVVKSNFHETPELGLDAPRLLQEACIGRALLVLSDGRIGTGLISSKQGDIVCFFLGSYFPMTLRSSDVKSENFYIVGRCYVDEIMSGEPLLGPLPANLRAVRQTVLGKRRRGFIDESRKELGMIFKDPRLEKMGFDLSDYKDAIEKNQSGSGTVTAGREDFWKIGVKLRDFDLI